MVAVRGPGYNRRDNIAPPHHSPQPLDGRPHLPDRLPFSPQPQGSAYPGNIIVVDATGPGTEIWKHWGMGTMAQEW